MRHEEPFCLLCIDQRCRSVLPLPQADAAIIQQGRLANADKTLAKGDLMAIVRFGADEIFRSSSSSDSGVTDADIDAILAQGEARTKAASDKLKRDSESPVSCEPRQ